MTSKATKRAPAHEPDAELGHLLEDAASAPPETRIEYRDRIAAHGADAVVAMEAWVEQGRSPGFAIAVLEAVGKSADDLGAASGAPPDRDQGAGLGGHCAAGAGADRGVGPGQRRGALPGGRVGCVLGRRRVHGDRDAAAGRRPLHRPQPRRVRVPQRRPVRARGRLGLHDALEGRDAPGRARVTEAARGSTGSGAGCLAGPVGAGARATGGGVAACASDASRRAHISAARTGPR